MAEIKVFVDGGRGLLIYLIALVAIIGCDQKPTLVVVQRDESTLPDCEITLQWIAPTEYEDDSPLAPENIKKFTLNWFNEDQTTIVSTDVNDPTVMTWLFLNMPAGKMSFRMTVTDTDEVESDWSNVISKTFADACGQS